MFGLWFPILAIGSSNFERAITERKVIVTYCYPALLIRKEISYRVKMSDYDPPELSTLKHLKRRCLFLIKRELAPYSFPIDSISERVDVVSSASC